MATTPVTNSVDRRLKISIDDPVLQRALAPLDVNGDGWIDINDIAEDPNACTSEKARRHRLYETVADAFIQTRILTEDQRVPFCRLFDTFEKIQTAKSLVDDWIDESSSRGRTLTGSRELEFVADDWRHLVLPYIADSGLGVGPNNLASALHFILAGLSDNRILREPLQQMVDTYRSISLQLANCSEVECEGKDCPADDERSIFVGEIRAIIPGMTFLDAMTNALDPLSNTPFSSYDE